MGRMDAKQSPNNPRGRWSRDTAITISKIRENYNVVVGGMTQTKNS
jgi:hypothetical protein